MKNLLFGMELDSSTRILIYENTEEYSNYKIILEFFESTNDTECKIIKDYFTNTDELLTFQKNLNDLIETFVNYNNRTNKP